MKFSAIVVTMASVAILGGCDNILGLDNRDAPSSVLSGRVIFEGEPVGVRSNGVQLELWEPRYEDQLYQKIPVHIDQDGSFTAALFDGEYKLNLLPNNGPWVNDPDTTLVQLNGQATVDLEVTPYYVIRDPSFARGQATAGNGGTVTGTFRVGQIAPSAQRQVEHVGVYISTTSFVDRNVNPLNISNAARERLRADIQTQLDTDAPISITVPLPERVFSTQSPVRREVVFARIGVKTTGVQEMLFSPVVEIDLEP